MGSGMPCLVKLREAETAMATATALTANAVRWCRCVMAATLSSGP
jgi:hypothetical protein